MRLGLAALYISIVLLHLAYFLTPRVAHEPMASAAIRARAALLGAFTADAASTGVHWCATYRVLRIAPAAYKHAFLCFLRILTHKMLVLH